ncbi:LysR family transcriptional regulator [Sporosarcina sp. FSL W7-1349]|uniref:LysR family transcriptional regulator n=1 Tax=Sporosarcina sp. FSL W7-1349 TaxID=2921561 RepID=UPI0030F7C69D
MLLEELKTFITVVEHQNFTKAAKELNLAQPTVSLHIKNLESELNVPLLVRSHRTFHVTPEGELLYERAIQLLKLAEKTKEEILWKHQEVSGKLRISASYTIGEYLLPEVLTVLHQKFPHLQAEVTIENTEDVETAVRELRCDVGCIEGSVPAKELIIKPFMFDELILVAVNTHPLAKLDHVELADLQSAHWIMREKGSGTRQFTDYLLRSIGQVNPSCTIFGSNEGVKQALLSGLGIAAVSVYTAKRALDRGELVPLKVDVISQKRVFSTLHSPLMGEKRHVEVFIKELKMMYGD